MQISLKQLIDDAINTTTSSFASENVEVSNLAITLLNLQDFENPQSASFRGDVPIFPASVVKLFYLVAAHQWLENGKLSLTKELKRALRDMIVDSNNDATNYIVDLLTDTTSGPELPEAEMEKWSYKRNEINRYFKSLGYENINVNKKTWGDGPYGRERIFAGENYEHRNKLTTDSVARLLQEIVTKRAVSKSRSQQMMELLARDLSVPSDDPDNQAHDFIGKILPRDAKLWSKAGWTSSVRHDAAYIELPNGARFILVIFTSNHSTRHEIISTIAKSIISKMA